jgi:ESS family glutamate:Na+ symporter
MIELQADGSWHVRPFLAVTAGILVLFVGKWLNARVAPLREYNIPEPVTGGLLFSVAFALLYAAAGIKVAFELTARDVLLVYFFVTIGLNAQFADLKNGGRPLLTLLAATAAFLVLQNLVAVGTAAALGYRPAAGLLVGSISLLGGHGTAIAWAPVFAEQFGVAQALEIGVLAATAGLVLASLAGGPLARFLIRRHRLQGEPAQQPEVGVHYGEQPRTNIDYDGFLRAILAIHFSGILGILANQALAAAGVRMPLFVTCLFAAIVLANVVPRLAPRLEWPSGTPALSLIAEVSLGVFLAMSLMSMQLWALAALAGPLVLLLLLQLAAVLLFAVFVLFPLLRRNYDAAVISAGFVGFGLGATPTAMANMTAVTQRHGASHVAFLVVPLVGAFFIDLINAVAVRLFLSAFG